MGNNNYTPETDCRPLDRGSGNIVQAQVLGVRPWCKGIRLVPALRLKGSTHDVERSMLCLHRNGIECVSSCTKRVQESSPAAHVQPFIRQ